MFYLMENGCITSLDNNNVHMQEGRKYIGISNYEEASRYAANFNVVPARFEKALNNPATRFESHEHMDVLCIPIVDFNNLEQEYQSLHIFLGKFQLLIVSKEHGMAGEILQKIAEDDSIDASFGRFLYDFFDKLLEKDSQFLDRLEDEIMALEDSVIVNKDKRDYFNYITNYRKQLLHLKRYYEQLLDAFNTLLVNENNLLEKQSVKLLNLHSGKLTRLHTSVMFLNDYISQIREAYQEEVDISLNMTMKVLTVITAVFYPLTLVVGWYGMNLQMPEFHWKYSYPLVVTVSMLIVIFTISYFKKKKWF